ncbi:hypothetical protein F383_38868 [Gossypium arboreum]|nr:hypothetical protein F383_38868 [Gossypium arboreum]
MANFEGS